MKPPAIFGMVVRLFGVYLLYQAITALSAYFTMAGISMPGLQMSMQNGYRPALVNVLVHAVAAIWFLYGAPPIQDWAYPDSTRGKDLDSTETPNTTGPFCVSCGKSVPAGSKTCAVCGWTQPG